MTVLPGALVDCLKNECHVANIPRIQFELSESNACIIHLVYHAFEHVLHMFAILPQRSAVSVHRGFTRFARIQKPVVGLSKV